MNQKRLLLYIAVFILKFTFFIGGIILFVSGIFDLVNGKIINGIIELAGGAAAVRLGIFLFSVNIEY
ncbi:MAG TPA: hypothetical protein PK544_09915 [Spirochaetota bacterium]|nr:hypothetical protein [Spirochaetota bacterium]HPJ37619.1 hypothetical protein [Spirochaetota bacterium]HPQ52931.1 hypothetical protein [Spirochaetota bacterium]